MVKSSFGEFFAQKGEFNKNICNFCLYRLIFLNFGKKCIELDDAQLPDDLHKEFSNSLIVHGQQPKFSKPVVQ